MVIFKKSRQGYPMIEEEGLSYNYSYFSKKKGLHFWRCTQKLDKNIRCKGSLSTTSLHNPTTVNESHKHTCLNWNTTENSENENLPPPRNVHIVHDVEFVNVLNFDEEDEEEYGDDDVFNENILNFDEDEEEDDDDNNNDEEINELRNSLDQLRQRYSNLEKINDNLHAEIKQKNDEIGEQNNELLELRERNIDLNGAKNRLEIQLKGKINQVKEKNNELLKLRENFDAKVKAEIELHLKNTQAFELKINAMEINKIEMITLNEKLKTELQIKIDAIKLQEFKHSEIVDNIRKELDYVKNENNKHVEIASKKITAFELKINAMEINKIEMNTLNEKLKSELQNKIDTIKLMELSHAEIVEKLRKELEDVKNENAKLDKNLNDANKTIEEKENELEIIKIRKEFADTSTIRNTTVSGLDNLYEDDDTRNRLRKENQKLRNDMINDQSFCDEEKKRHRLVEEKYQNEIAELKAKLEVMEREKTLLSQQNDEFKYKLDNINAK